MKKNIAKKRINRLVGVLLIFALVFAFAGCSSKNNNEASKDTAVTGKSDSAEKASNTENTDSFEKKTLIVYFSATGTTKEVAEKLQSEAGADIFEIVPTEVYTSADLDYNDSASRTSIERKDRAIRPEISNKIDNIADYDVIFLGYPIWWNEAPNILYTFVESYDLTGKTVIPFCTSGGSGIGSSAKNLAKSASGANWLDGERLTSSTVSDWLNSLNY